VDQLIGISQCTYNWLTS